jgi:Tol biopolymer transport system component/DNA-binding winged helix-turn-helix (wHTH) protein
MTQLNFRDFTIDPAGRRLLRSSAPVLLPGKTFDLLLYMARNPGRPLLKEELLSAVWPDSIVEESNLTHTIYLLRRALTAAGTSGPDPILTLPGRGYQFTCVVTSVPIEAQPVPVEPSQPITAHTTSTPRRRWFFAALTTLLVLTVAAVLLVRPQPTLHVARTVQLTDDGVSKHLFLSHPNLFNDGTRLRFIERRNNQSFLADVPLNGGDVHTVPAPGAALTSYSALNHTLLFGSDWREDDSAPVLAQHLGGNATQLGELTGHEASWSPDAHLIAIARDRFLYLSNPNGSNLHRIATADGIVHTIRWSPDGHTISFSVNTGGLRDSLWLVHTDGSDLHALFPDIREPSSVCCGVWSADGANFFYLVQNSVTNSIWALPSRPPLSLHKPKPFQLTISENEVWAPPLPTPDGHALWAIGSHLRGELVALEPVTRQFRPFLGGISAEGVSFSSDRQWIAYTAYPEGTLWISHPDGLAKRQLTSSSLVARYPQWSPDGRTIAFIASQIGSEWHIYLVPASGGTPQRLIQDSASEGVPNWSPDGKQIAFGRILEYADEHNPDLTIEIYDLDHHNHTTIHGSEGLWTPRWSPDGRYLTAVTQDNRTLRLYDLRTRQWSDLASLGVNDAIWSRDSRFLYFDTGLGTDPNLYRIAFDPAHPNDHRPERWADLSGLRRGGFYGPWLGITPDGNPILLKDTSIEEVYRLDLSASR